MSIVENYAAGTPSWVELAAADRPTAIKFYESLFGWDCRIGPDELMNYTGVFKDDEVVAGMGLKPDDMDMPSVWTTYFASDDVDETTKKIVSAGGQILFPAMTIDDPATHERIGSMAIAVDPVGAIFGVWQAGTTTGARRVNEPGTLTWNDCLSREAERSREFYATVCGWTNDQIGDGGKFDYTTGSVNGKVVGGIMQMGAELPDEIPSNWMTYFAVDNAVETADKAVSLGANLIMEPADTQRGRLAVIQDPQGAVFAIIEPSDQ